MALAVGSALPGDAATRELATLSALPNEILQDICGYLPLPALAKLYSTSKSLRSLLSDAETWRERVVAPATRAEASFTRWLASLPPNSVQIAARGVDPYTLLKHHGGSVREAQLLFKDETSFDQVVPGHTFPFLSKLAIRVDIEEEDLCPSNIGTCFLRDIMRACPGLITLHLAVFFHEEVSDPSIGSAQPSIFGEPGELSAKPIFGKQSLLRELSVTGDPLFFAQIDEQLNCQWGHFSANHADGLHRFFEDCVSLMQQRDALSDIVVCAVRGCCIRITDSGVWYKKLDRDEIQPEKEGPDGSIEGPVPDSFLCHHGSLDEGGRVAHLVGSDFFTDEPDDEFDFDFDYDPGYYDYEEDYGNQWDSDDEPGMFGFHPDGYNIAAIRWD